MPSHAELAAKLLRDAATFFQAVGSENPQLEGQMNENAAIFGQVADLVEKDPNGQVES